MALTIYNPIRDVCEAALSVFPGLDCHVSFADFPEGGPRGTTEWAENRDAAAIVQVDVRLPMAGVVEVLAHELAHVAAGLDADHGPEWQDAFERIRVAYCERIEAQDEALNEVVSAMEANSSRCQSSCSPPKLDDVGPFYPPSANHGHPKLSSLLAAQLGMTWCRSIGLPPLPGTNHPTSARAPLKGDPAVEGLIGDRI